MGNFFIDILGFTACASIIIFSGSKLSIYGDKIAEITGLGKAWVGLILMASVTSLPELITGISAVSIINAPDLAAGDIFGSCMFNLLILSVLDARIKKPLFSLVKSSHILVVIFGIILLTIVGIAIHLTNQIPSILWMSSFTFLIFAIYIVSVWGIFKYEQADLMKSGETNNTHTIYDKVELKKVIGNYALHALVVICAAIFLPYFGEKIASTTGLGNSFFATLFIAAATSLPELVVSVAALRMGSLDMAVGNLLGSNIFNMFILGIDDLFYREGSIFFAISPTHLLSVLVVIIMSAVVALGLLFRPEKKQLWVFSLDTFIIIVLYVFVMIYLLLN